MTASVSKMTLKYFVLLCIYLILSVDGYSRGAPDSVCTSMVPGHSGSPRPLPSPFGLAADKTAISPGETVQVAIGTLPGNSGPFKGFLVQARDAATNKIIGIFEQPTDRNAKLVSCAPGLQNAVTHGNSARKQRSVLKWQAPADFEGEVIFRATFVEDYSNFWTDVESERLRVTRQVEGPADVEPQPEAPSSTSTTTTTTTTSTTQAPTTRRPEPTTAQTTRAPVAAEAPRASGTPAWSFSTTPQPAPVAQLHAIYDGCGNIKGCFGMPDGCVESGNCQLLVSYMVKGDKYLFELRGLVDQPTTGGYVAIGFSKDDNMGEESVTECVYRPTQAKKVDVFNSANNGKSNTRLHSKGLSLLSSSMEENYMYCKFERDEVIPDDQFNTTLSQKHHLLLARGALSNDRINYHGSSNRIASSQTIDLASLAAVAGRSEILVRVHGALMITAWIWAASCGILIARYFKQTWVGKQFMGKDLWFVFHRALMVSAWALTIAGFVIIFVEVGGWSAIPAYINPHPILGCVTTGLAFIQPIMAYFRPHPGTSRRWIFNWAHWFVGNSAHILGVATIFFAIELPKAGLAANEVAMYGLVGAYVAFHVTMHLIFSVYQCCQESRNSERDFALKDLSHRNGTVPFTVDRKSDASGSTLRKLLLSLYLLFVTAITAALIAVVVISPDMQVKNTKL